MTTKMIRILKIFIGPFLLAVALWVLHEELKTVHFQDALQSLRELPGQSILLCLLLTVLSYLIMSGYDLLALRYIRHPLPYPKIGLASFIGSAFSNNIGLSMLAGGSVRYPLYSSLSQLPGGLGVFETVVIFLSTPVLPAHGLVAALLAYKGVYYFLPLLVAAGLLAARRSLRGKREPSGFFRPSVTGPRTWCRKFSRSPPLPGGRSSCFPAPLRP
jgi:uncharacterized membrane protein YbhN (UPF0104 family)